MAWSCCLLRSGRGLCPSLSVGGESDETESKGLDRFPGLESEAIIEFGDTGSTEGDTLYHTQCRIRRIPTKRLSAYVNYTVNQIWIYVNEISA